MLFAHHQKAIQFLAVENGIDKDRWLGSNYAQTWGFSPRHVIAVDLARSKQNNNNKSNKLY